MWSHYIHIQTPNLWSSNYINKLMRLCSVVKPYAQKCVLHVALQSTQVVLHRGALPLPCKSVRTYQDLRGQMPNSGTCSLYTLTRIMPQRAMLPPRPTIPRALQNSRTFGWKVDKGSSRTASKLTYRTDSMTHSWPFYKSASSIVTYIHPRYTADLYIKIPYPTYLFQLHTSHLHVPR